jgi:hypothetical protein
VPTKSTRGKWVLPFSEVPRASPGLCFPVLGRSIIPWLIAPSDNLGFHSGFSVVFVFPGCFLRKNASCRSRVSVHSLGRGRGALRKPYPPGVSCGVCYFLALFLANLKLGFIGVRSEAPGTIPGPPLICVESWYILDENLTFMIHHRSFLCFGATPGSSPSMPFGFLACAAVHSLASPVRPGRKPALRIRIPLGVSCGVCQLLAVSIAKISDTRRTRSQSPKYLKHLKYFPSVFSVVFVFPGCFLRKNASWRSRVSSISWAGGGGPSESQFHPVFPVVFVISGLFPVQKSSLAFFASDWKLLGRSRGPLSSVSDRCIFSKKTSPL